MRINWLSILRGWVVILVIIYHTTINTNKYSPDVLNNIFRQINYIFNFRMELFFFISGFLLYYTKIQKDSSFKVILKERIPRIVYPYLFFTLVLFSLKVIFNDYVGVPVEPTLSYLLNIFLYPKIYFLWRWLWFLNTILIFFLLYPFLKYSLKNKYTILCASCVCLGLHLFFPKEVNFLDLSRVASFILFFYFGILFAKFQLQDYLKNKALGMGLLVFFIMSLFFDYKNLLHSFSGIGVSVCFALYCSEKIPNLFSSFRNYYYQIYLIGTLFHLEILQKYAKIESFQAYLIACFFSALAGIYMPVLISKIIQRLNWKPLLKVVGF